MFVYSEGSARRLHTPWGREVRKRLADRDMKQEDLRKILESDGIIISKVQLSELLRGIGISVRGDIIKDINKILEIPCEACEE